VTQVASTVFDTAHPIRVGFLSGLPMGADYWVTSCDLGIFVDEATESITPYNPNAARRIRAICPVRWLLSRASVWATDADQITVWMYEDTNVWTESSTNIRMPSDLDGRDFRQAQGRPRLLRERILLAD
jgi:hypothetical protein